MASGDPACDGAGLWTRVSGAGGAPVPVRWRVARDPDLLEVVASGEVEAEAEADHTAHVEAGGLEPATTYWYGFSAGDVRSPVGRTRTAPRSADRLRVGVVCCSHWTTGFFNAYGRMAERDVDLVVHLGDYIYENETRREGGVRLHRPADRCVTLADYRARHAQYRTDPDLRRLHARHPVVAIWDDHELAGNAWWDGAGGHNPRSDGDWATRRAAAARAYREWMPLRLPDPADPFRLWRRVRLGPLADLLVLDTRLVGRARPAATRRPVLGVWRRGRSLLGEKQWRWLAEELTGGGPVGAEGTAHWRLVASQVVVSPVHLIAVPDRLERLGRALGAVGGGLVVNSGQWDGYPDERDRLMSLLAARGSGGTVVLSGDLHSSWASELAAGVEFVVPSVSAPSFARALAPNVPGGRRLLERVIRSQNSHIRWLDTAGHGYLLLDLTAERAEAQWWHVDTVRRRHPGEHLAATWSVDYDGTRLVSDRATMGKEPT